MYIILEMEYEGKEKHFALLKILFNLNTYAISSSVSGGSIRIRLITLAAKAFFLFSGSTDM